MTWTRLSDTFTTDPRVMRLSDPAFRLHVKALVWCNQHLTDGVLPVEALGMLMHTHPHPELLAAEMVKVGLWVDLHDELGWAVDWTDQEDADVVLARRQRIADKQKRYRDRKSRHESGDHTQCDPRKCPDLKGSVTGNTTGNETSNVMGRVTHSRPVPSRPPTGTGTGAAGGPENSPPASAPQGAAHATCAVCSLPEDKCRAAARTNGHPFTPTTNGTKRDPEPVGPMVALLLEADAEGAG